MAFIAPSDTPYGRIHRHAARLGTERHGRCTATSSNADRPSRSAVVPGAPSTGISCFANAAPIWNETMATDALSTAVLVDGWLDKRPIVAETRALRSSCAL